MRRQVGGWLFLQRCLLRRRQLRFKSLSDCAGNFALNGEDVRDVAIVRLGPDMRVIARIDQLCAHPHFATCTSHTSFQDVGNAQRLRDIAQVSLRARRIGPHARSRDDLQVGDL